MEKILLVEDEVELRRATSTIISFNGYDVSTAEDGMQALDMVKSSSYDLIVMDIMMPKIDGITALKEMRKIGINTPVILLTAKSMVDDKVEGLDAGANDYLTKPFEAKELMARIRAILRSKEEENKKYVIGNLSFDKEKSELSTNVARLNLNSSECKIMEILVKNTERVVPKEEILGRVWENEKEKEKLPMYMSYLKDKFSILEADVYINENNGYIIEKL